MCTFVTFGSRLNSSCRPHHHLIIRFLYQAAEATVSPAEAPAAAPLAASSAGGASSSADVASPSASAADAGPEDDEADEEPEDTSKGISACLPPYNLRSPGPRMVLGFVGLG